MILIKFRYRIRLFLYVLLPFLALISCTENSPKENRTIGNDKKDAAETGKYPKFEFTKEIHKFGKISEGEIGVFDFYFKNTGKSRLIIKNIESNCGCTEFKWTKKPINAGEESKITIEFNSKGRYGKQYKVITIYSNALQKKKKLFISANVE